MPTPTKIVRQLRGGQITIPVEFRRELGIEPDTLFQVSVEDGSLRITPVQIGATGADSRWIKELYDYFAPVRESIAAAGYSEEEVNADIDAAIRAVRAERD
jgi:bifunctional DNA-binding transcriptional regulator/antitoxin component of YhaV-PrlF toxin-antitoxin module